MPSVSAIDVDSSNELRYGECNPEASTGCSSFALDDLPTCDPNEVDEAYGIIRTVGNKDLSPLVCHADRGCTQEEFHANIVGGSTPILTGSSLPEYQGCWYQTQLMLEDAGSMGVVIGKILAVESTSTFNSLLRVGVVKNADDFDGYVHTIYYNLTINEDGTYSIDHENPIAFTGQHERKGGGFLNANWEYSNTAVGTVELDPGMYYAVTAIVQHERNRANNGGARTAFNFCNGGVGTCIDALSYGFTLAGSLADVGNLNRYADPIEPLDFRQNYFLGYSNYNGNEGFCNAAGYRYNSGSTDSAKRCCGNDVADYKYVYDDGTVCTNRQDNPQLFTLMPFLGDGSFCEDVMQGQTFGSAVDPSNYNNNDGTDGCCGDDRQFLCSPNEAFTCSDIDIVENGIEACTGIPGCTTNIGSCSLKVEYESIDCSQYAVDDGFSIACSQAAPEVCYATGNACTKVACTSDQCPSNFCNQQNVCEGTPITASCSSITDRTQCVGATECNWGPAPYGAGDSGFVLDEQNTDGSLSAAWLCQQSDADRVADEAPDGVGNNILRLPADHPASVGEKLWKWWYAPDLTHTIVGAPTTDIVSNGQEFFACNVNYDGRAKLAEPEYSYSTSEVNNQENCLNTFNTLISYEQDTGGTVLDQMLKAATGDETAAFNYAAGAGTAIASHSLVCNPTDNGGTAQTHKRLAWGRADGTLRPENMCGSCQLNTVASGVAISTLIDDASGANNEWKIAFGKLFCNVFPGDDYCDYTEFLTPEETSKTQVVTEFEGIDTTTLEFTDKQSYATKNCLEIDALDESNIALTGVGCPHLDDAFVHCRIGQTIETADVGSEGYDTCCLVRQEDLHDVSTACEYITFDAFTFIDEDNELAIDHTNLQAFCESKGADYISPLNRPSAFCSGRSFNTTESGNDFCCFGGRWYTDTAEVAYSVYTTNESFICHQSSNEGRFAECCGSYGCNNVAGSNPRSLFDEEYFIIENNVRLREVRQYVATSDSILEGEPAETGYFVAGGRLHTIENYDVVNDQGALINYALRVDNIEVTGYTINLQQNNIYDRTRIRNGDTYLISGLTLELGPEYDPRGERIDITFTPTNPSLGSCTVNVSDHVTASFGEGTWTNVRINSFSSICPQWNNEDTSSLDIDIGTIMFTMPETELTDIQIYLDNIAWIPVSGQNTPTYFCTGDFGTWVQNLDGPSNDFGYFDTTAIPPSDPMRNEANITQFATACDAQRTMGWTGNACCGDDTRDPISQRVVEGGQVDDTLALRSEFYNDTLAGCFAGHMLPTTRRGDQVTGDAYFDNVIYADGKFQVCGSGEDITAFKSNINGDTTLTDDVENQDLFVEREEFTIVNNWVCQNDIWEDLNSIKKTKIIAASLLDMAYYQDGEVRDGGYDLYCDKFSSLTSWTPEITQSRIGEIAEDFTDACILYLPRDVSEENDDITVLGLGVRGRRSIENITTELFEMLGPNFYNLVPAEVEEQFKTEACVREDTIISNQDFYYVCDLSDDDGVYDDAFAAAGGELRIGYNSDLNILLVGLGSDLNELQNTVLGTKTVSGGFFRTFWDRFTGLFTGWFGDPDNTNDAANYLNSINFNEQSFRNLYLGYRETNGNPRTIRGILTTRDDGANPFALPTDFFVDPADRDEGTRFPTSEYLVVEFDGFASDVKPLYVELFNFYPRSTNYFHTGDKQVVVIKDPNATFRYPNQVNSPNYFDWRAVTAFRTINPEYPTTNTWNEAPKTEYFAQLNYGAWAAGEILSTEFTWQGDNATNLDESDPKEVIVRCNPSCTLNNALVEVGVGETITLETVSVQNNDEFTFTVNVFTDYFGNLIQIHQESIQVTPK